MIWKTIGLSLVYALLKYWKNLSNPKFLPTSTHNLHNNCQLTYRPRHSTEAAISKVFNDLFLSPNKGKISVLAVLEFSSELYIVDHPILVHRLHTAFVFTDTVLQWFLSYLTDRIHYVSPYSHCSAFVPVHSGGSQGSVLGLIFFIMYNKPMFAIIDSHSIIHHLFADELQSQMSAPQIEYLSYFTLYSHVYVVSKLGQLQICLSLMKTRQNSCLSPQKDQSIYISYLLLSLWVMLKFPSNSLWKIWVLHWTVFLLWMHMSPILLRHASLNCVVWHLFVYSWQVLQLPHLYLLFFY